MVNLPITLYRTVWLNKHRIKTLQLPLWVLSFYQKKIFLSKNSLSPIFLLEWTVFTWMLSLNKMKVLAQEVSVCILLTVKLNCVYNLLLVWRRLDRLFKKIFLVFFYNFFENALKYQFKQAD